MGLFDAGETTILDSATRPLTSQLAAPLRAAITIQSSSKQTTQCVAGVLV
jgi:hypothetical protein